MEYFSKPKFNPELVLDLVLQKRSSIQIYPYKSDVFSFGLIVLNLTTLELINRDDVPETMKNKI